MTSATAVRRPQGRLKRLLTLVLAPMLGVLGLGLTAAAPGWSATASATGFVAEAVDIDGNPIVGAGWTVYTYNPTTGSWDVPQYGPRLTDEAGQFSWNTVVGGRYKVCFQDEHYGEAAPDREVRYATRCWTDAADEASATIFTQPEAPVSATLRVVLPVAGKSLTASEPWVDGNPQVGSALTVHPGAWGPSGVQLSYQWGWFDTSNGWSFVPLTGENAATFTPTADLDGRRVAVQVTGAMDGYVSATMTAHAGTVGSGVALSSPLTISGSRAVGGVLTATPGAPVGTTAESELYFWRVDGAVVSWSKTLTLTADMAGKSVSLRYWIRSTAGNDETSYVVQTGPIAPGTLTAPTPTISGTLKVGSTLTAVPGAWGPAPVAYAYQWYRSGTAITGATGSTYVLTASDLGKTMTVKVTGSKTGYTTVAKTSAATTAVLGALTTAKPTISGTVKVGYTLTAKPGTWGPAPVTLRYQWYRSGTAITGATASTYILTSTDKGKTITVKVTGSKTGYYTTSQVSAATAAVL